jgi:hypothetical protein
MMGKKVAPATGGKLKVVKADAKSEARLLADNSLAASTTAMAAALPYAKNVFGEADVNELCASLRDKIRAVRDGNMDGPEALLVGQATSLNVIYTELTRRAALNMGEYIQAAERYMRLALKAQAQCRATIETLAALKNPPVVYARQANIAGQQQVNNYADPGSAPPAEKSEGAPNKLLEGK